ncbi:MAG TPA: universal stress protein [Phycisphaerales bacterium]|nr:universal stress protein [Phycisphaerales bacterium]
MGYKTSGQMVLGLPHIEINRLVDKYDCSLVVVGSHGRTMAGEIFLGGVASSVLHNATRPVLVLRLKLKDEEGKKVCEPAICDPLHHVLFPTDFSDNAERAFAHVKKIAECGADQITLLHVQDKGNIDRHLRAKLEEFNQIDTERLERLKVEIEGLGAKKVNVELPYGSPKKEIIDRTRQDDISLVIMGTQGRGYVGELLLGSVSYAVARHSQTSVLLIRAIR